MKFSLIVPVYNEENTIDIFYQTVRNYSPFEQDDVVIIFINDGSVDKTESIINHLAKEDTLVEALSFTRNFGKEAALMAGLHAAQGDFAIPIDVDLQDPIDTIPKMIQKWRKGAEVVLAKRNDRSTDSWFKRTSAHAFYSIHNALSKPKIEPNVGDFRLLDISIVHEICQLPEKNLFMKGIFSWVGGRTEIVTYERAKRCAGKSKFNGWKLWNLALEGITSFSTAPLRVWTYLGLGIASLSLIYALYLLLGKIFFGNPVPGYPSLMVSILFLGGIQLIGIGVLGEYIGRIYIETKNRPAYILKKKKHLSNNLHENSEN